MIMEIELRDKPESQQKTPKGSLIDWAVAPGTFVTIRLRYKEKGPVITEKKIRVTDFHGNIDVR